MPLVQRSWQQTCTTADAQLYGAMAEADVHMAGDRCVNAMTMHDMTFIIYIHIYIHEWPMTHDYRAHLEFPRGWHVVPHADHHVAAHSDGAEAIAGGMGRVRGGEGGGGGEGGEGGGGGEGGEGEGGEGEGVGEGEGGGVVRVVVRVRGVQGW